MPVYKRESVNSVLVVGGGVGGMRAAVDLAEAGLKVYLVENMPWLGGRVAQLGYMFPTHDCVLCRGTSDHGYGCTRPSISPAFLDNNLHPNIEILTNTDLINLAGYAGDFTVTLRHRPNYVDAKQCINCGMCEAVCPVSLPSPFQMELSARKAIYKMAPRALPDAYVLDKVPRCETCRRCEAVCPTSAVDLDEQESELDVRVGAIILSLGYTLSDPTEYEELGFGRFPNVIHSMQYERLASRSGPTEGVVMRPSDGKVPQRIAWLQCVGSRDEEHPYCSSICCMYATKEAMLAKQRAGDDGVHCQIFMMDERAFNKEFNAYYQQAQGEYGVEYTRCRISIVGEDPKTNDLILRYPNETGTFTESQFDMVVLSVGALPPSGSRDLADLLGIELNPYGFCATDTFAPLETSKSGIYVCGTFSSPKEIAETILDAAGAAGDAMRLLSGEVGGGQAYGHEYPFLAESSDFPPERDIAGEEARVGVFVCRCYPSIAGVVDTDAVVDFVGALPGVAHIETSEYACLDDGQKQIQRVIEEYNLNRVVVAACSHRTHESLFQRIARQAGLNPYLLEIANIREHCAWPHVNDPAGATRAAKELVRLAVARARLAEPVHKQAIEPVRRALVIGGGVSGMTSALNIADAGYDVTLVERGPGLGGNLQHIYYLAEGDNPQRLLRDMVNRVLGHRRIDVMMNAEVVSHEGSVGTFTSIVRSTYGDVSEDVQVEHAVAIVATGGQEWRGDIFLLGQDERVVTSFDLEEIIVHQPKRVTDLKEVVFIQCVGRSADGGEVEYCSRTCCTNTMKNAIRIKMLNPDCRVVVLYKDIITYGFREEYYTEARRRGVLFVRYDDARRPQVRVNDQGQLELVAWESSLQQEIVLRPDLLSLSMAIRPSEGTNELAHVLDVPLSSEGFFLEDHIKMRPMDFTKEGIFICGLAHYPKFIGECITNAQAAAGRAITILSTPQMYIGGVISVIDQDRCVGCLTCVRTCPFTIPKVRYEDMGVGEIKGAAYIDPAICTGCGTCTAECPAKAIQLIAYQDEQIMGLPLGAWAEKVTCS
ncbi:MAG: CoB--CoM heterodisulfide reductase iron-sulfur subunit A family protein [Chloroflexi bacterium]|nr:CoB--CoM heterodisulfide reductase iron-sulfur subunit A family protein [Chloroflexota bacterium]